MGNSTLQVLVRLYYKGEKYESTHSGTGGDFHGQDETIKKELAARILPHKGSRVLDVGTGFGKNVEFLSKLFPDDVKIWTIDPSEDTLENAKKVLREKNLGASVTFVKGGAENLPFEDGFFDLVVSVVVLHHLEALEAPIREMVRVLKRSGKLILVDWSPESHVLPFESRHRKEDFFEPEKVVSLIEKNGIPSPDLKEFQYWYLIEAVK